MIKAVTDSKNKDLIFVYGAVGGGKEDFLADEEFNNIEQIILEETRLLQGMINKYKN